MPCDKKFGAALREHLVLREILVKDLIPLLAADGYTGRISGRGANLVLDCRQKALQLRLFHPMRGLNFIADKFSLQLRPKGLDRIAY